eukprot:356295-Chlamydomonas_euryale.AAC.29
MLHTKRLASDRRRLRAARLDRGPHPLPIAGIGASLRRCLTARASAIPSRRLPSVVPPPSRSRSSPTRPGGYTKASGSRWRRRARCRWLCGRRRPAAHACRCLAA